MLRIGMPGKTFLTKMSEEPPDSHGNVYLHCRCVCGNRKRVRRDHFQRGGVRSCGCMTARLISAGKKTHGQAGHGALRTTEYRIWSLMIQRCTNDKNPAYKDYGGRGITVCTRWLKFENFFEDMGRRPKGLTLDRKNNDKGYYKRNCRWATLAQQSKNRRPSRRAA